MTRTAGPSCLWLAPACELGPFRCRAMVAKWGTSVPAGLAPHSQCLGIHRWAVQVRATCVLCSGGLKPRALHIQPSTDP